MKRFAALTMACVMLCCLAACTEQQAVSVYDYETQETEEETTTETTKTTTTKRPTTTRRTTVKTTRSTTTPTTVYTGPELPTFSFPQLPISCSYWYHGEHRSRVTITDVTHYCSPDSGNPFTVGAFIYCTVTVEETDGSYVSPARIGYVVKDSEGNVVEEGGEGENYVNVGDVVEFSILCYPLEWNEHYTVEFMDYYQD